MHGTDESPQACCEIWKHACTHTHRATFFKQMIHWCLTAYSLLNILQWCAFQTLNSMLFNNACDWEDWCRNSVIALKVVVNKKPFALLYACKLLYYL